MKYIFLIALVAAISSNSFAGKLVNRATGSSLHSKCISYDAYDECVALEVTAELMHGTSTTVFEKQQLEARNYRDRKRANYLNTTLSLPGAIGYATLSNTLMILTLPITIPVGLVIDTVRVPFVTTRLIKDVRKVSLIRFLFDTENMKTKRINHGAFMSILNSLRISH